MSQDSLIISNASGASVRSQINSAFATLVTLNAGANEPSVKSAYMLWADTTAALLKLRNSTNTAWVTLGALDTTRLGLLPLSGGTMTGALHFVDVSDAVKSDSSTFEGFTAQNTSAGATAAAALVAYNNVGNTAQLMVLGGGFSTTGPYTANAAVFRSSGGEVVVGTTGNYTLNLMTNGAVRAYITGAGSAAFAGAVTFNGAIVTNAGITTNGQIAFPSTQNPSANPNTLDDYEEGTWSPGITFGGAAVGVSYAVQTGSYTKIGNIIRGEYFMALSSKGSSTGAAKITGFAFTGNSFNHDISYWANLTTAFIRLRHPVISASGLDVVGDTAATTNSATGTTLTDSHFNNDSILAAHFTIRV